jgi:hypothetical protein
MLLSMSWKSIRISLSGRMQVSITRRASTLSVAWIEPRRSVIEAHHVADVVAGADDRGADDRLLDVVDVGGIRHAARGCPPRRRAVVERHAVDDRGVGVDDVEVELAAQALLDDVHVEQAEEAAAEAEAEGHGALGVEGEGRIVEVQLLQSLAHLLEVLSADRIDAAEDHRPHSL